MAKIKARALRPETRKEIGQYRASNPKVPYSKIAIKFSCTEEQAKQAAYAYRDGRLRTKRTGKARANQAKLLSDGSTPEDLFLAQIKFALAQLAADENLEAPARVQALEKIAYIRRVQQQMELEGLLKRRDAVLIAALIRYFMPEATKEDIKRIYTEVMAQCQASL